jgi:phosphatidylinositol kinase/protein kinase (PI-3  family)
MLARDGQIIHIDFGFMFSNSPGGNINFESCPFKLTQVFIIIFISYLIEISEHPPLI